jgi:hypothetical protein
MKVKLPGVGGALFDIINLLVVVLGPEPGSFAR